MMAPFGRKAHSGHGQRKRGHDEPGSQWPSWGRAYDRTDSDKPKPRKHRVHRYRSWDSNAAGVTSGRARQIGCGARARRLPGGSNRHFPLRSYEVVRIMKARAQGLLVGIAVVAAFWLIWSRLRIHVWVRLSGWQLLVLFVALALGIFLVLDYFFNRAQ
jgi:hypothetical protein